MGLREDSLKNNGDEKVASKSKIKMKVSRPAATLLAQKKKNNKNKNLKQIFVLSFDALRERKARSALTISMVVAGCDLIVALNGMCACQVAFTSKKAIKYLGIAWHGMACGQHLPSCGDHHNNIEHPRFHVSITICNPTGNTLSRLSKRTPPVVIEYF
jgi:hypothetical protein